MIAITTNNSISVNADLPRRSDMLFPLPTTPHQTLRVNIELPYVRSSAR
jgi:hypothetical protein